MFKTCICGSGNFVQEEDDDNPAWISASSSPSSSPNRRKTRSNSCKNNNNKNPYSNRGRDKFETVLAELEQRRQMIYQQHMGSEDQIEMIRFAYSNSKACWVPIVVKLGDQKQKDKASGDHKEKKNSDHNSEVENMKKSASSSSSSPITEVTEEPKRDSDEIKKKKQRVVVTLKNMVRFLSRYAYDYWAVMVIILIMLCLVIYGRSFAIICTCVFWYLIPLMKGNKEENLNLMRRRRSMKKKILKKDFVRSKSEQKMNTTTTASTNNDGFSSPKSKMNLGSGGLSSSLR